MIKRPKIFGFLMSGLAAILVVGGVLYVWIGNNGVMTVSTDSHAIYSGSSESSVALMFNVYSGSDYIPSILDTLDEKGVKATFFIGGCWAEKNENLLKNIYERGHEIGSHGYLHKDHDKLNYKANCDEMRVTHSLIKGILGYDITLFAPPSGAYSVVTLDASEAMGYKTILWTKDTIDWRDHDTELILKRATDGVKGGDMVLMHPTENTAEALPRIIDGIKSANLLPTTVSDTL